MPLPAYVLDQCSADEQEGIARYDGVFRRFQAECGPGRIVVFGRVHRQDGAHWHHCRAWPDDPAVSFPPPPGSPFWIWDKESRQTLAARVYRLGPEPNPNQGGPPQLFVIRLMVV